MLTKRHFIMSTAALVSAPLSVVALEAPEAAVAPAVRRPVADRSKWAAWDARGTPANYDPATSNPWGVHRRFLPQFVEANANLTPGDIHVDAVARYLYHIEPDGSTAMRYGVAIARGSLYEPGVYTMRRKAKWPT